MGTKRSPTGRNTSSFGTHSSKVYLPMPNLPLPCSALAKPIGLPCHLHRDQINLPQISRRRTLTSTQSPRTGLMRHTLRLKMPLLSTNQVAKKLYMVKNKRRRKEASAPRYCLPSSILLLGASRPSLQLTLLKLHLVLTMPRRSWACCPLVLRCRRNRSKDQSNSEDGTTVARVPCMSTVRYLLPTAGDLPRRVSTSRHILMGTRWSRACPEIRTLRCRLLISRRSRRSVVWDGRGRSWLGGRRAERSRMGLRL